MRAPEGTSYSSRKVSLAVMRTLRVSPSRRIEAAPSISAMTACPFGARASKSSSTRGSPLVMSTPPATPPVWNVRMVSCVPGSPMLCAAMIPTASPIATGFPLARLRP